MKINKEKEVNAEIHKKRTGKIHKKNETKIDNKSMTTRAGRSVTSVGKMAESAITENVEGGENIEWQAKESERKHQTREKNLPKSQQRMLQKM